MSDIKLYWKGEKKNNNIWALTILQKSTSSFAMNSQQEGSDKTVEAKAAVVR